MYYDQVNDIYLVSKMDQIIKVQRPVSATYISGVFNLCQHFEISYSRYANKYYITGVYIAINEIYR
jgi:hypothetical protein